LAEQERDPTAKDCLVRFGVWYIMQVLNKEKTSNTFYNKSIIKYLNTP
jgi:hypothetical protein